MEWRSTAGTFWRLEAKGEALVVEVVNGLVLDFRRRVHLVVQANGKANCGLRMCARRDRLTCDLESFRN